MAFAAGLRVIERPQAIAHQLDVLERIGYRPTHPFLFLNRGGLIRNLYCCRDSILRRVSMVNPAEVATSQE